MNWIYTKVMAWAFGEAMANSDRIRTAVYGFAISALTLIAGQCPVCNTVLTPEVSKWIAGLVGGLAVAIISALSKRDIAAPDETVPGEAIDLPPAPKTADGVPG